MPRLAVLPDFPAEGWPSMDLCAEMLLAHLPPDLAAANLCPPYRRLPLGPTLNRACNRYIRYPTRIRRVAARFDLFHIVDHSYAHLVHSLPAGRAGVYCHDLDLFRCLFDPTADRRPWWFRRLARRVLVGLQAAAVVFHNSAATGDELRRTGLIDPGRLVHAPLGVAPEFSAAPADPPTWLRKLGDRPWVAHVGSCIPRKRVDVLLDVLATNPDLWLVKVGGVWSSNHRATIDRHGICSRIVHLDSLSRTDLAAVYRHAGAVLVPSGRRVRATSDRSPGVRGGGDRQRPAGFTRGRRAGGGVRAGRRRARVVGRCPPGVRRPRPTPGGPAGLGRPVHLAGSRGSDRRRVPPAARVAGLTGCAPINHRAAGPATTEDTRECVGSPG